MVTVVIRVVSPRVRTAVVVYGAQVSKAETRLAVKEWNSNQDTRLCCALSVKDSNRFGIGFSKSFFFYTTPPPYRVHLERSKVLGTLHIHVCFVR